MSTIKKMLVASMNSVPNVEHLAEDIEILLWTPTTMGNRTPGAILSVGEINTRLATFAGDVVLEGPQEMYVVDGTTGEDDVRSVLDDLPKETPILVVVRRILQEEENVIHVTVESSTAGQELELGIPF